MSWPLLIILLFLTWFTGYVAWREGVGLPTVLAGLVAMLQLMALFAVKAWWELRRERPRPETPPRRKPPPPQTLKGLYRDRPDQYRRRKGRG
jgi:hypothetical protein